MDKKNEKTFADLFSSSNTKNDNKVDPNDKTFECLVSELFSSDTLRNITNDSDNSLLFSDLDKIDSSDNETLSNDFESEKEVELDIKLEEDSSNLFFDDASEALDSNKVELEEEQNTVENNSSNLFFDDAAEALDSNKVELEEEQNTVENNSSNLFFEDAAEVLDSNEVELEEEQNTVENNSSNLFFEDAAEVLDSNEVELEEEQNTVENNSSNLFFDDAAEALDSNKVELEEEQNTVENNSSNLFFDDVTEVLDSNKMELQEPVNSNIDDKLGETSNNVPQSVSPFFEDNILNNEIKDNILGNMNISLDETNNINSKISKIDFSNTKNFNVKVVKKKEPLLKFIVSVISYAFFIFLMLVLVALLVYVLDIKIRAAKGDNSPPTFNAYVVLTGSMLPDIKVKDVVVTKKVPANELKVDDVITFASADTRYAGTIITHRIIKKNQDKDGLITFQTKGDNNNVADSALVTPGNIYGKVILKIPKLGFLQDFLATQGGWVIVILIPCMTVISYDIVKLSKGLKKKKIKVIK